MNRNTADDTIDLRILYFIWEKKKKNIIILVLIGLAIGILFSGALYIKDNAGVSYSITSSMAITTVNSGGNYLTNTANPGYNDIKLAEDIVDSVIYVTKSDRVLQAAIDRLEIIGVSPLAIKNALTVTQVKNSQIISMTLSWDNVNEGIRIVEAISEVLPDILVKTLNLGSVSVIDYAANKGVQHESFKVHFALLIAIVLGGGYFALMFLEKLIHATITDSINAEETLHINCLGSIPDNYKYFTTKPFGASPDSDRDSYLVWEALSSTAHLMKHSFSEGENNCYYITSSIAHEGKTSIGANLGLQLSLQGKKVLMIDFDVRRPSLGPCFFEKIDHEHSLNAVYNDECDIHSAIMKVNDNLDVIPARLENQRIMIDHRLMDKVVPLKAEYDFVLIDAAPVGIVADTMMLNYLADRAIFVIKYDYCWLSTIKGSIERLNKSGIKVCGTILSGVMPSVYEGYVYRKNYKEYYSAMHNSENGEKSARKRSYLPKKADKKEENN